jgi:alpha-D-ribose 1-methylphosphonate 5-phosphate C-P lyase
MQREFAVRRVDARAVKLCCLSAGRAVGSPAAWGKGGVQVVARVFCLEGDNQCFQVVNRRFHVKN